MEKGLEWITSFSQKELFSIRKELRKVGGQLGKLRESSRSLEKKMTTSSKYYLTLGWSSRLYQVTILSSAPSTGHRVPELVWDHVGHHTPKEGAKPHSRGAGIWGNRDLTGLSQQLSPDTHSHRANSTSVTGRFSYILYVEKYFSWHNIYNRDAFIYFFLVFVILKLFYTFNCIVEEIWSTGRL